MKRFSKIVSVMTLSPLAMLMSTRNCACMSVGKPGWGAVVALPGEARRGGERGRAPLARDSTPASRSFCDERLERGEVDVLERHVAPARRLPRSCTCPPRSGPE